MRKFKGFGTRLLIAMMLVSLMLGGVGATTALSDEVGHPDTWIADRHLVGRSFIDDQGGTFPDSFTNNLVAQKIKELTGITIEWQYTAGADDMEVMTTQLAAGDLPDIITTYVDNSSRPEFPILLKAAREGRFVDVAPYLKEGKVYSKYFEDGYLPEDTKSSVMFRPEFNGACYLVHINIPRNPGTTSMPYVGGMKIQKSIAEALEIDPRTVRTQDDLYNLLVKIRDGNFTDSNGNTVSPLGPRFWGGSYESATDPILNYMVASSTSNNFALVDGKIIYDMSTDNVLKQVEFYQKLLSEDLINPEYFTMDATRADEFCRSGSAAIIGSSHNFCDLYQSAEYLPVGPLLDYNGDYNISYQSGKSGWCAWAIPSTTQNPEEVVKFCDFLATYEGKLITKYGVEGETYDMVDNMPIVRPEILDLLNTDRRAVQNMGLEVASAWLSFIGSTDRDDKLDFGELSYGENSNPHQYDFAMEQYNFCPPGEIIYLEGFDPRGFLSELPEVEPNLNPLLQQSEDFKVRAVFSGSSEAAKSILDNYYHQLQAAGLDQFIEHLQKIYDENPASIRFIPRSSEKHAAAFQ